MRGAGGGGRYVLRWRGEVTSSARRVSRCRGLGAAVVKFSIKENSSNSSFFFFLTSDLSECLLLTLAFSILKTVQSPITVCYCTEYNICKSKMKSRFELENHGRVIKTKETGHSDVVKTPFSLVPFKISLQQNQPDFTRHFSSWQSPSLWRSSFSGRAHRSVPPVAGW